jgi:hypothetical protein
MKKVYPVELSDTLVAIGIILAFLGVMGVIALMTGL